MSDFIIEDYTPEPTENEYDEAVKALLSAGEGKKIVLPPVAVEDEAKARRRFGAAANRAGKSPKSAGKTESKDGKTVRLAFRLVAQREYNKKDDAAEAAGDGPAE